MNRSPHNKHVYLVKKDKVRRLLIPTEISITAASRLHVATRTPCARDDRDEYNIKILKCHPKILLFRQKLSPSRLTKQGMYGLGLEYRLS